MVEVGASFCRSTERPSRYFSRARRWLVVSSRLPGDTVANEHRRGLVHHAGASPFLSISLPPSLSSFLSVFISLVLSLWFSRGVGNSPARGDGSSLAYVS